MGSRPEVWKLVQPVTPCGGSARRFGGGGGSTSTSSGGKKLDIRQVREQIAAVGARVGSIGEHIDALKAALPELDSKIRYASLGMPTCSFPLAELQSLKTIHFKLLRFWEEMSCKQLEKLEGLSQCLQTLEEQKRRSRNTLPDGIDAYEGFGQHRDEKVISDIRKSQELEVKLYFDKISSVPKSSKPTHTLYSPLKRDLQRIPIRSAADLPRAPAPPSPAQERILTPLGTPRWNSSGQKCKGSATTPSTVCNTIQV